MTLLTLCVYLERRSVFSQTLVSRHCKATPYNSITSKHF